MKNDDYLGCVGKNRFETRKDAKKTAQYWLKRSKSRRLHPYKCKVCHYWHLTSVRQGKNRQIKVIAG